MYTPSPSLILLALSFGLSFGSVYAIDDTPSSPLVKRVPDTLQHRQTPPVGSGSDPMNGLVEINAPSDVDQLVARTPTPVAAPDPDPNPNPDPEAAPAPEAAAQPEPFQLEERSPLLDYDGADVLEKRTRTSCPANPLPSNRGCQCNGQTLCKKKRRQGYNGGYGGGQGTCVFLQTDEENCGSCFNECGSDQQCKGGACKCSRRNLTACGARCVNTQTDSRNCGSCGYWCPYGRKCRNGTCRRSSY